jgi:hypothetical protein
MHIEQSSLRDVCVNSCPNDTRLCFKVRGSLLLKVWESNLMNCHRSAYSIRDITISETNKTRSFGPEFSENNDNQLFIPCNALPFMRQLSS